MKNQMINYEHMFTVNKQQIRERTSSSCIFNGSIYPNTFDFYLYKYWYI